MIALTLEDTEKAIKSAFDNYLIGDEKSFKMDLSGHEVEVNVKSDKACYDCGTPGFNMKNKDVGQLSIWVKKNIWYEHESKLFQGVLLPCKDIGRQGHKHGQVNVLLRAKQRFNFHVNLVHKC